jgi:hypothetical protein
MDGQVRFLAGARFFSLLHSFQKGSGAHPASYTMNTGCSSTSPYVFSAWCLLIKHRENFTFFYLIVWEVMKPENIYKTFLEQKLPPQILDLY